METTKQHKDVTDLSGVQTCPCLNGGKLEQLKTLWARNRAWTSHSHKEAAHPTNHDSVGNELHFKRYLVTFAPPIRNILCARLQHTLLCILILQEVAAIEKFQTFSCAYSCIFLSDPQTFF